MNVLIVKILNYFEKHGIYDITSINVKNSEFGDDHTIAIEFDHKGRARCISMSFYDELIHLTSLDYIASCYEGKLIHELGVWTMEEAISYE